MFKTKIGQRPSRHSSTTQTIEPQESISSLSLDKPIKLKLPKHSVSPNWMNRTYKTKFLQQRLDLGLDVCVCVKFELDN
jgi:hypothetical protein